MKNIALVVSDYNNAEIRKNLSALTPKLNEKYNVTVIAYNGAPAADLEENLIILNSGDKKENALAGFICEIKRISALRKITKEENLRLLMSLSEESNFAVAFSFVPVKKSIFCPSFASLFKNEKKYGGMLKQADAILTRTHSLGAAIKEKFPTLASKVKSVEIHVDTERISALSKEAISEEYAAFYKEHKTIAVSAPFTYEKGQWNILKAFSMVKDSVKDAGLVFIGKGGELADAIKKMASESIYNKDILFIEEEENPYKYIANANGYVQSDISDGAQVYLLEAMASNTPVAAADCMTAEILFDNYDPKFKCDKMMFADYGIITPSFDTKENYSYEATYSEHMDLANAMKEMILSERIPALLKQKALKSLERYSSEKVLKNHVEFVDKLYLCL